MTIKHLITNGNSWTYGSEIFSPSTDPKKHIFAQPWEDHYRKYNTWPAFLARLYSAKLTDESFPGKSNLSIFESTHLAVQEKINEGVNPEEILVVVGWGLLNWKEVIYQQDKQHFQFTVKPNYNKREEKDRIDIDYKFNTWYQNLNEYIQQNYSLHLYLKSLNVKHFFFNTFSIISLTTSFENAYLKKTSVQAAINSLKYYAPNMKSLSNWDYDRQIKRLQLMWAEIPDRNIYEKQSGGTMVHTILELLSKKSAIIRTHPSIPAHIEFSKSLYKSIDL